MDFCICLSTKQGNSGRLAVTQADWIMSLVFRFQERFFKVPDDDTVEDELSSDGFNQAHVDELDGIFTTCTEEVKSAIGALKRHKSGSEDLLKPGPGCSKRR